MEAEILQRFLENVVEPVHTQLGPHTKMLGVVKYFRWGTILFKLTKIKSACEVNIHIFWLSLCGLPAEPDCTEIDDNLRVRQKCKLCRAVAPLHGET